MKKKLKGAEDEKKIIFGDYNGKYNYAVICM